MLITPGTTREEIKPQSGIQKNRNLPVHTVVNTIPCDGASLVCFDQVPHPTSPSPGSRSEPGGRAAMWGWEHEVFWRAPEKPFFPPWTREEGADPVPPQPGAPHFQDGERTKLFHALEPRGPGSTQTTPKHPIPTEPELFSVRETWAPGPGGVGGGLATPGRDRHESGGVK